MNTGLLLGDLMKGRHDSSSRRLRERRSRVVDVQRTLLSTKNKDIERLQLLAAPHTVTHMDPVEFAAGLRVVTTNLTTLCAESPFT